MKTYMALDGLRWSRDSGSVHCDMPGSAVFGRPEGAYPYNNYRPTPYIQGVAIGGLWFSGQ